MNNNYVNGVTNMFDKITIPYESVMLFNIVKLKENVTIEDVEGLIGEMCFVVKNNYPGFRAGQVFKYSGFISDEGSVGDFGKEGNHIAIVTYWDSFEEQGSDPDLPMLECPAGHLLGKSPCMHPFCTELSAAAPLRRRAANRRAAGRSARQVASNITRTPRISQATCTGDG